MRDGNRADGTGHRDQCVLSSLVEPVFTLLSGGQCVLASQLFGAGSSGAVRILLPRVSGSATVEVYSTVDCTGSFTSGPGRTDGQCVAESGRDSRLTWVVVPTTFSVWSGVYRVDSTCITGTCCCIAGTFAASQVGLEVTATVGLIGNCSGNTYADVILTLPSGLATTGSMTVLGRVITVVKSGTSLTLTNVAAPSCSGTATCTSGDCTVGPASTACFHESTVISYRGRDVTLAQLRGSNVEGCRVPHVVRARGVVMQARCAAAATGGKGEERFVRLTRDHLVFTPTGLRAAESVGLGDTVYADLAQSRPCVVYRLARESDEQTFFGLNCEESEVLANGVKTSTFGTYHTVPALWMKWASWVLGVDRASRWGDHVVDALSKLRAI